MPCTYWRTVSARAGMAPSIQAPIWTVAAARNVAPKARRDLDREAELSVPHATVHICIVLDRPLFGEVPGASDLHGIVPADSRIVAIEDREGKIFDVQVDAVTDGEHQNHAADDRQGGADRVTAEFERLAAGVGEHAAQIEEAL